MPKGVITVRQLKNKDTGIDITVPSYKDIPNFLGGVTEYHLIVITNMTYFKTTQHNKSDIVQFTVKKRFGEFEELYNKLSARYPSTILPSMPSKMGLFTDGLSNERRIGFDTFLKFVAANEKLCSSPLLLEFLGADTDKVEKLVASAHSKSEDSEVSEEIFDAHSAVRPKKKPEKADLFDEEDAEEGDLFADKPVISVKTVHPEPEPMFDPLLNPNVGTKMKAPIKLYEEQDLESAVSPDDDFFPPGAKVEMDKSEYITNLDEDLDLLRIDDDLEKFLNFPVKKSKPPVKPKPSMKPKPAPRHKVHKASPTTEGSDNNDANKLADEDILKYINENLEASNKDDDLFGN